MLKSCWNSHHEILYTLEMLHTKFFDCLPLENLLLNIYQYTTDKCPSVLIFLCCFLMFWFRLCIFWQDDKVHSNFFHFIFVTLTMRTSTWTYIIYLINAPCIWLLFSRFCALCVDTSSSLLGTDTPCQATRMPSSLHVELPQCRCLHRFYYSDTLVGLVRTRFLV